MADHSRATPNGFWCLRLGGTSLLFNRRATLLLGSAMLVLLLTAVVALTLGSGQMNASQVVQTLAGQGSRMHELMLFQIRLPRVLAVMLAGAALGLSGCLVQTLVQNRLATPDMIGVNEGATMAIVIFSLYLTVGSWPWWAAPLGAVLAAACLFTLCRRPGEQGYLFIVVGIALTELFQALSEFAMSSQPIAHLSALYMWTMGHFAGQGYRVVVPVALCLLVLLPPVALLLRALSVLRLGSATAQGLGVPVVAVQLALLGLAILIAGLGAAIGGPVIFVGMAAPILASWLLRSGPVPVWLAAALGALLLLLADTLVRVLADPVEMPAGLMTRILGGVLLLALLLQNRKRVD
ncbi:MAG TPA: iron ABC transporter permease [Pseudomonas pachastrellae]|nr:iron ABC transporter permease [Halopseudomonas pachastrellae]